MYQHILVTTDGSEFSQRAVRHAVSLAKALAARVTFLTVVTLPDGLPERSDMDGNGPADLRRLAVADLYTESERALSAAAAVALMAAVPHAAVRLEHQHPHRAIAEFAETSACDLIVMASHGRSGFSVAVDRKRDLASSHS